MKILAVKYIFSYKRKLIFGTSKWIKGNLQSQRSTNLHFITAYSYLLSMIHTQWRFKFQDYHKIFVVHFLVILQKYFKKNRNRNSHNEINLWRRNLQIFRASLDNCSWIRSCSNFKISFFSCQNNIAAKPIFQRNFCFCKTYLYLLLLITLFVHFCLSSTSELWHAPLASAF